MYPWFYVWSPAYRIFHEVLQFGAKDISGIELKPQFVPQSIFEKKNENKHHLTGNGIKIHILIKILEAHKDQFIIFSDADLIVLDKNLSEKLKTYEVNDITCLKEKIDSTEYNIGFMLLKGTPEVISFLQKVLQQIRTHTMLDQDAFNQEINTFEGTHGFFSTKDFIQSNMIRKDIWDTGNYSLIQCLSSNPNRKDSMEEKLHTIIYFYDIRHLLGFVEKDVVLALREYLEVHNPSHYLCNIDIASATQ